MSKIKQNNKIITCCVLIIYMGPCMHVLYHLLLQDAGVHALSNVCHVDVERISKRKPGEVVLQVDLIFVYQFFLTFCAISAVDYIIVLAS